MEQSPKCIVPGKGGRRTTTVLLEPHTKQGMVLLKRPMVEKIDGARDYCESMLAPSHVLHISLLVVEREIEVSLVRRADGQAMCADGT